MEISIPGSKGGILDLCHFPIIIFPLKLGKGGLIKVRNRLLISYLFYFVGSPNPQRSPSLKCAKCEIYTVRGASYGGSDGEYKLTRTKSAKRPVYKHLTKSSYLKYVDWPFYNGWTIGPMATDWLPFFYNTHRGQ